MPQFIYRIQPTRADMLTTGPDDREARIIGDHFDYLKALTETGEVLTAGRTLTVDERSFGMVVLEAESEAAA